MTKEFSKPNPLKDYLGQPEETQEPETTEQQAPNKIVIKKPETKTERVQLLMKPSLVKALKKDAKKKGLSLNGLVNAILQAYIEQ